MTVRIADLHLTFATTMTTIPRPLHYGIQKFLCRSGCQSSIFHSLMKGYESPVSRFEILTNGPKIPQWALLRFTRTRPIPEELTLLEEDSRAVRAGLVLRLRFGGKPHRLGCLPPPSLQEPPPMSSNWCLVVGPKGYRSYAFSHANPESQAHGQVNIPWSQLAQEQVRLPVWTI